MNKVNNSQIKFYIFFALSLIISTNVAICMKNLEIVHSKKVIDLAKSKIEEHPNVLFSKISNNGKFLLLSLTGSSAKIINLKTNTEKTFKNIDSLNPHLNAFSFNSRFLILASKYSSIRLINLEKINLPEYDYLYEFNYMPEFSVAEKLENIKFRDSKITNDGKFLLVTYNDTKYLSNPFYSGTIEIINLENAQYVSFENVSYNECTISKDSKFLTIHRRNKNGELVKLESGKIIKTFGNVKKIEFSENSETLSISYYNNQNSVEVFDLKNYIIVKEFKNNLLSKCNKLDSTKHNNFNDVRINTLS